MDCNRLHFISTRKSYTICTLNLYVIDYQYNLLTASENDNEPSGMPSLLEHFRGEEIIADHFDTENRAFVGALFFVWVVAGATGNGGN